MVMHILQILMSLFLLSVVGAYLAIAVFLKMARVRMTQVQHLRLRRK